MIFNHTLFSEEKAIWQNIRFACKTECGIIKFQGGFMEVIREEFINGFCRTTNETRTVCCEYEQLSDGTWKLTDYECNVDSCPNSAACQIYKEAREKGGTF